MWEQGQQKRRPVKFSDRLASTNRSCGPDAPHISRRSGLHAPVCRITGSRSVHRVLQIIRIVVYLFNEQKTHLMAKMCGNSEKKKGGMVSRYPLKCY